MDTATYTPGSFCTSVLRTRDITRAAAFYDALVGWTTRKVSDNPPHAFFELRGKTVASLHQIADGPDRWVPHVSVENIERTTTDAVALGAMNHACSLGGVSRFVHTVPKAGRIGSIFDAGGAVFVMRSQKL